MPISRSKPTRTATVGPIGIVPGSGYSASAQSYSQMADIGANITNEALAFLGQQAKIEGENAGIAAGMQVDDQGIPIAPEIGNQFTTREQSFAKAAMAAYESNVNNSAYSQAKVLETKHQFDPDGFNKSWVAFSEQVLKGVDPNVANRVRGTLISVGAMGQASVLSKTKNRDQAIANKDLEDSLENNFKTSANIAEMGAVGTPLWNQQRELYKNSTDALVTNRVMSPEGAQKAMRRFDDMGKAYGLVGKALTTANAAIKSGRGDINDALAEIETLKKMDLDPEVRATAIARLTGEINSSLNRVNIQRSIEAGRRYEATMAFYADPAPITPAKIEKYAMGPQAKFQLTKSLESQDRAELRRQNDESWNGMKAGFLQGLVPATMVQHAIDNNWLNPEDVPQAAAMLAESGRRLTTAAKKAGSTAYQMEADRGTVPHPQYVAETQKAFEDGILTYGQMRDYNKTHKKTIQTQSDLAVANKKAASGTFTMTQDELKAFEKSESDKYNFKQGQKDGVTRTEPLLDFTSPGNQGEKDKAFEAFVRITGHLPPSGKDNFQAAMMSDDTEALGRAIYQWRRLTEGPGNAAMRARLEKDVGPTNAAMYDRITEMLTNADKGKWLDIRNTAIQDRDNASVDRRVTSRFKVEDLPAMGRDSLFRVLQNDDHARMMVLGDGGSPFSGDSYQLQDGPPGPLSFFNVGSKSVPEWRPDMQRQYEDRMMYEAQQGHIRQDKSNMQAVSDKVTAEILGSNSVEDLGNGPVWVKNSIRKAWRQQFVDRGLQPPEDIENFIRQDMLARYQLFTGVERKGFSSNDQINPVSNDNGSYDLYISHLGSTEPVKVVPGYRPDWETSPLNPMRKEYYDRLRESALFKILPRFMTGTDIKGAETEFNKQLEAIKSQQDAMALFENIQGLKEMIGMPSSEPPAWLYDKNMFKKSSDIGGVPGPAAIADFFKLELIRPLSVVTRAFLPISPTKSEADGKQ